MKSMRTLVMTLVVLVLLLSLALTGCSNGAVAPQTAQAAASSVETPAATMGTANNTGNGRDEGIQVHGHWIIEVTNPDGSVAEYREFENALLESGGWALGTILGRAVTVGGWWVQLMYSDDHNESILEPSSELSGEGVSKDLTLTIPDSGENYRKLILRGTSTCEQTASIITVRTFISMNPNNQAPSDVYYVPWEFTSTSLAEPIEVTMGQQVAVTVMFSFS